MSTKPGQLQVECRGLIEVEFGLGRASSGGQPGRLMRQVEMEEDALHGEGREMKGAILISPFQAGHRRGRMSAPW